jgi:hypothetical protein
LEAKGEDLSVSSKPNLLVLFNPVMRTTYYPITERMGSEKMALKVSPNDHLDPSVPPMIIFFGSDDDLNRFAYETVELSTDLGLDVQLWIAEGEKHAFFNNSPWLESTIYLTDIFLEENKYVEGDPTIELPEDGIMVKLEYP